MLLEIGQFFDCFKNRNFERFKFLTGLILIWQNDQSIRFDVNITAKLFYKVAIVQEVEDVAAIFLEA